MKKNILISLLITSALNGWEVNTHRAIEQTALAQANNLNTFVADVQIGSQKYFDEVFEGYSDKQSGNAISYFNYFNKNKSNDGMADLGQTFENQYNYQDLIEAGCMLEDAEWPNANTPGDGRFLNHFYYYQGNLCKSLWCVNKDAVTWAFNDGNNYAENYNNKGGNYYDYADALNYFARAFSEPDKSDRRKYRAKMFVSVGHIMHMLNDMNVPAHVRNDPHAFDEPFEKYMRGGEKHNQPIGFYVPGSTAKNYLGVSSGGSKKYSNFSASMHTEAEYTSTHYVSEDTMGTLNVVFPNVHPNLYDRKVVFAKDMGYGVKKSYLVSTMADNIGTKLGIRIESFIVDAIDVMLTDTQFNPFVALFDGDNSVLEENGKDLISRAVANAEGFVNYFFRGRLETKPAPCGGLEVKNDSDPSLVASTDAVVFKKGGVFKVYADDANGNRTYLTEQKLTNDLPVGDTMHIDGVTQAYTSAFGEPSGNVEVVVVYSGDIGQDGGVAVSRASFDPEAVPSGVPTAISGAVEVTLSWSEGGNNFDLNLDMPGSVKDVQSCMREHAYVKSEYEIYPGRYPVNVNYAGGGYHSDTYYVTIQTPSETKVLKFDTNASGFDPGHVADIDVKYVDNKPVLVLTPKKPSSLIFSSPVVSSGGGGWGSSGGGGGGGGYRYTSSSSSVCSPAKSCGCMPCEYKIIPYLGQVIKGPLSGADISLFSTEGYRTDTPLYTGKTGEGDDLCTAGLLNVPQAVIDSLDDNGLYVFEVSGGLDIDRNDDMEVDDVFTPNNAVLHAVLSGADLKAIKPKVSILTEIAYQIVREDIMNGTDSQSILETLDDVATRLLSTKIYPTSPYPLNHVDLAEWLPTIDKPILFTDYETRIVPIIDKLQTGEDIYQEAYDVVYYPDGVVPIVKSAIFGVPENSAIGTTVGQVIVLSDGVSSVTGMELTGEGKEAFSIDSDGRITTSTPLDYETKPLYSLFVRAQNSDGFGRYTAVYVQVSDVVDAPYAVSFAAETVYANAGLGDKIAQITFDPGASAITSMRLEGDDSSSFDIDLNGIITLANPLEDFFVKKFYRFNVIAANASGDSTPACVIINVADRRDVPQIGSLWASVNENVMPGTRVATVPVVSDGDSPITSFSLSGTTSFTVDDNGTIYVAPDGVLDYEEQQTWEFYVTATNVIGDSHPKNMTIAVNDLPDTPPVLHDVNISINKETVIGTVIANIFKSSGDSPVSYAALSPDSPFSIDVAGDIRLEHSLFEQENDFFSLRAEAENASGKSERADVNITLITIPVVSDFSATVFDNTSSGTVIGRIKIVGNGNPIESVALSGDGSSDFHLALDGTISVADGITVQAARQNYYHLFLTVNGIYEAEVNVEVRNRIIGAVGTPDIAIGVTLSTDGTKAYVTDRSFGLHVIDVTDPTAPYIIGVVDTSNLANGITLSTDGTKVYVADGKSGLQIIDVINPTVPYIVGKANTSGFSQDVILSSDGTKAYVADRASGLQIIDVTDPTAPYVIGTADTPSYAAGVTLSLDGTKAYVADDNSGLQVIDVTNANAPYIIGTANTPGDACGVFVTSDDTKAYVADGYSGLQIIDVTHPTAPANIGTVDTPGHANRVILSSDGTKAYVVDEYWGLQIIDISDSTALNIIGFIDTSGNAYDVALSPDGTKAYMADGGSGLKVIDVSGFEVPEKVPGIIGFSNAMEATSTVGAHAGHVKIVYTGSGGITDFKLTGDGAEDFEIDLNGDVTLKNELDYATRNIYNLKAVATNAIGDRAVDVTIRIHAVPELQDFTGKINSMAPEGTYVGQIDMWVDDNTTITDITLYGEGSENFTLDYDGRLYVAAGAELHHFVTPEYSLNVVATNLYGSGKETKVRISIDAIIGTVDTPNYAQNITLSSDGKKAYVADWYSGLQIIDVVNPSAPKIIGSVDTPVNAKSVALSSDGKKAYVADGSTSLQIIDVTDPVVPYIIGTADVPGKANDVIISPDGTKAYVTDTYSPYIQGSYSGLQIVEVIDPNTAYSIGSIDTPDNAYSVVLSHDGTKAYVANFRAGLQIIDISDPTVPYITGTADTPDAAEDVVLSSDGTKAYVADSSSGLQIIDITDPTVPYITGSVDMPGYATDLTISPDGTKVYVTSMSTTLMIVDITDPTAPKIIKSVDFPDYTNGVALSSDGKKAYIANNSSGLKIIDLTGLE